MNEENQENKKFAEKSQESLKKLANHPAIVKIKELANDNKGETAAFILLILGLLISFANPLWGGALIGLIAGYYFHDSILDQLSHVGNYIKQLGPLKAAILLVLLILLFIAYPLLLISVTIVVSIMKLIEIVNKKS